jgi:hypothetical protein
MVDERGEKSKWWKRGGGERKYEITTSLFS